MLRTPAKEPIDPASQALSLEEKYERLKEILAALESLVVAYSGGVDSTLLLKVALDVLGPERVMAVTADSETYPTRERREAREIAAILGAPLRIVETSELSVPGYAENNRDRCYFCRHNLFEYLLPIAEELGFSHVAYGLIADDLGDYRPGVRAAIERGVRGPLQEALFTKGEVRELSRRLGLPTWNKPALACLSSRVAYGERITKEKLSMIDRAEELIRGLGFSQVRVRIHGDVARIEVTPAEIPRLVESRQEIVQALRSYGCRFVTVDLAGFESGSMNRSLA